MKVTLFSSNIFNTWSVGTFCILSPQRESSTSFWFSPWPPDSTVSSHFYSYYIKLWSSSDLLKIDKNHLKIPFFYSTGYNGASTLLSSSFLTSSMSNLETVIDIGSSTKDFQGSDSRDDDLNLIFSSKLLYDLVGSCPQTHFIFLVLLLPDSMASFSMWSSPSSMLSFSFKYFKTSSDDLFSMSV